MNNLNSIKLKKIIIIASSSFNVQLKKISRLLDYYYFVSCSDKNKSKSVSLNYTRTVHIGKGRIKTPKFYLYAVK